MSAAVKSVEDHGYLLDIGLSDVTGFLKRKREEQDLVVGSYVDLAVDKLADDGRTCIFTSDPKEFKHASVSEFYISSRFTLTDFRLKRFLLLHRSFQACWYRASLRTLLPQA